MSLSLPAPHLLRQVAGALVWGAFFILAPIEVLVGGAIVWLPLLAWRELRRAHRYGFLPGGAIRGAVVAAIVVTAAYLPVKSWDARLGPFPQAQVTLGELAAARVILPLRDPALEKVPVSLPSTTPTRREVRQAISQRKDLRIGYLQCGNGATILFGASLSPIRVSAQPAGS
jgi:hypothetical protein